MLRQFSAQGSHGIVLNKVDKFSSILKNLIKIGKKRAPFCFELN